MMKKLLILMLVMGVASTANAALTLVSSAGDTLDPTGATNPSITMIGIHNDTAAAGQGQGVWLTITETGQGQWTGVMNSFVPPSPELAELIHYGVVDPGDGVMVDLIEANLAKIPSVNPWGEGVLSDFEFMCTQQPGDVTITLLDNDLVTVLDTLTISQVPEPITFGLLGLGGLFLRRRK
jgi:hypothetical protein